jgi:hypothetical protein
LHIGFGLGKRGMSKTKAVIWTHPEWISLQAVEVGIHQNYPLAKIESQERASLNSVEPLINANNIPISHFLFISYGYDFLDRDPDH